MILCDRADIEFFTQSGVWGEATLDGLLRSAAERHPDKPALLSHDAGNWTPLTFGELDKKVDRMAQLLMASGLRQDDVVAYQLSNSVEAYVTFFGVMRAQGIACPLPLPWRESELSAALSQVNARFVVTCKSYGGHAYADMMRFVAAEIFSVRRLMSYGADLPDGVESIDELLSGAGDMDVPSPRREAANHIATFCFDTAEGAPHPIARTHNEWLAASRMPLAAMRLNADSRILSGQYPTRLAAIASAVGPWLLTGSTLCIYDPLDFPLDDDAIAGCEATATLLPFGAFDALAAENRLNTACSIGVIWNAGILANKHPPLEAYGANITDIICFNETAMVARRRKQGEMAAELRIGELRPAEVGLETGALLELKVTGAPEGELLIGGAMLPSAVLGTAESNMPRIGRTGRDFRPSGLKCKVSAGSSGRVQISGMTGAVLHVANSPVAADELDQVLRQHSGVSDAASFSVPHKVMGSSLHAALAVEPNRRVSIEDLLTFLSMKRIGVHKLPDAVSVVDAIPRDANSNVLREQLRRTG